MKSCHLFQINSYNTYLNLCVFFYNQDLKNEKKLKLNFIILNFLFEFVDVLLLKYYLWIILLKCGVMLYEDFKMKEVNNYPNKLSCEQLTAYISVNLSSYVGVTILVLCCGSPHCGFVP